AYRVFSEAEVEALCALPAPNGHLMTLLLWTGLRRTEARFLTGKRLDLDRRQVIVKDGAKGAKSRVVPMIQRVEIACAELLTLEGIKPDDYVWATRPGGRGPVRRTVPMSQTSFSGGPKHPKWWEKCLEAA